ncbi:hypothetical protein GCM10010430_22300 [Kitasatospora cystarginea]|uniref:Uncharacterized protein n=1 Tax=Kitasatospora cystarginea TaxID=58350 RepID=A0ABN3DSR9_9ACTN
MRCQYERAATASAMPQTAKALKPTQPISGASAEVGKSPARTVEWLCGGGQMTECHARLVRSAA